jgi:hypothetical protein
MESILLSAVPDQGWLADARAQVAERPETLARHFAAARRKVGREPLAALPGWTADEAARALLLAALPEGRAAEEAVNIYTHGDAAEKRAVLKALPMLDAGAAATPLLHDAIRSNDASLVAAALGPCARQLDQPMWRQGVLKCVFMGVRLAVVDGLADRADAELATMLAAFAGERAAAGRTTPDDAVALLCRLTSAEEA